MASDSLKLKSLVVGGGSTLSKFLKGAVSVNPANIVAGTKAAIVVAVPGAVVGNFIEFNPPAGLNGGLVFSGAVVTGANQATIYLFNSTEADIDDGAANWIYLLIG